MSSKTILIIAIISLMTIVSFQALAAEQSDAADIDPKKIPDAIIIQGDVVLQEDKVYDDESNIVFLSGTNLDIGDHTIDFGSKTNLYFLSPVTIVSEGGHLKIGEETTIVSLDDIIPKIRSGYTVSFEGTLSYTDSVYGKGNGAVTFVPSGEDSCIHIESAKRTILVDNPGLKITKTKNLVETTILFTEITTITDTLGEDGTLLSTSTVVYIAGSEDPVVISLSKSGQEIRKLDITEITSHEHYMLSNNDSYTDIKGIGPNSVSLDENYILHMETAADTLVTERYKAGAFDGSLTFTNIKIKAKIDVEKIIQSILDEGISIDVAIEVPITVDFTADSLDVMDDGRNVTKHITDIHVKIDEMDSEKYSFLATFKNEGTTYTITATDAVFESFGLSLQWVLGTKVSMAEVNMDAVTESGDKSCVRMKDVSLILNDLDLKKLYYIYAGNGELNLQNLIDYSDRVQLQFSEMKYDRDGDDNMDVIVHGFDGIICKDTIGLNTLTLMFEDLFVRTDRGISGAKVIVNDTQLNLQTSGSLTECLEAFYRGVTFTTDSQTEIQISNAGFRIEDVNGTDDIVVACGKNSPTSPNYMTLVVSLTHIMHTDETEVQTKLSAPGYDVGFKRDTVFTDPPGRANFTILAHDPSGSFDLIYGDDIDFSLLFNCPWQLDVYYYDIEFQIDVIGASLNLSHGKLDVKGYDQSKEGLLDVFFDLIQKDFTMDSRFDLNANDIVIYKENRSVVYETYSDAEFEAKKAHVDLKREDMLTIGLDRLSLNFVTSDGSVMDKQLKHLDINKDLAGRVPEKSFLEKYANYLIALFGLTSLVLLVIILYYRLKSPELFKLKE